MRTVTPYVEIIHAIIGNCAATGNWERLQVDAMRVDDAALRTIRHSRRQRRIGLAEAMFYASRGVKYRLEGKIEAAASAEENAEHCLRIAALYAPRGRRSGSRP